MKGEGKSIFYIIVVAKFFLIHFCIYISITRIFITNKSKDAYVVSENIVSNNKSTEIPKIKKNDLSDQIASS